MKRMLSIHKPIIAHLPQDAALLSVIGNHHCEYAWIMNNFVNLRMNKSVEYDDFARMDMWYNCYFIEDNALTRQYILNCITEDFSHFIKLCIDNDYYVLPYLNKQHIPAYKDNIPARHSPLIYGYDESNKTVFLADFFSYTYGYATATFNELQRSIEYHEDEHEWYPYKLFRIFKKKKGYAYTFNLHYLKKQVEDYATSRNMYDTFPQFSTNDMEEKLFFGITEAYRDNFWGLSCYDILSDLTYYPKTNNWPLRAFYLMRAHKKIMRYRIEYLNKEYTLPHYSFLKNTCDELESRSIQNQNIFLKSRILPYFHYNDRLSNRLKEMKKIDESFTKVLLDDLADITNCAGEKR